MKKIFKEGDILTLEQADDINYLFNRFTKARTLKNQNKEPDSIRTNHNEEVALI